LGCPDGKKIVGVDGTKLVVWSEDASGEWQKSQLGPAANFFGTWLVSEGRKVITMKANYGGSERDEVSVWDTQTGQHLFVLEDQGSRFWGSVIDISRDGRKILTEGGFADPSRKEVFAVWDIETGDLLSVLNSGQPLSRTGPRNAKFNFDGSLVVQLSPEGELLLWQAVGRQSSPIKMKSKGTALYTSPSQNIFVTSPDFHQQIPWLFWSAEY
jgi:WD40 repeat protein